jgi:hypothetical protein
MKIKSLREFKKLLKKKSLESSEGMRATGILPNGNSVKLIPGTLLKNMSKTNVMLENSFVFGYEAAYFDG